MTVYDKPVWEEPTVKPQQGKYEPVLEELTRHPNAWGKIGEYKTRSSAYQAALNLKHGRYKIPGTAKDWEFVADGEGVYAMYLAESTNGETKVGTKKKS